MNERTLIIDVATRAQVTERMQAAFHGREEATARYSFATRADLLRTLNPNRWGLIEALAGNEALGVRELARRVGRDVKSVHTDAQLLATCGLIDKLPDGKLSFPYSVVHVDFRLRAA